MLTTNDITARDADRDNITRLTAAFIAKGGKVLCIPTGYTPTDSQTPDTIKRIKAANKIKQNRSAMLYQGKVMTQKEISRLTGLSFATIRSRMITGLTLEDAIDKVKKKRKSYWLE